MKYDVQIFQKTNLKETKGFSPSKSTPVKNAVLNESAVNKWVHVCSIGSTLNGDEITSTFLQLFVEDFYTFDYPGPVYIGHIDYERAPGQPEPAAAAYVRALELTEEGSLYALYEYRTDTWNEVEDGGFQFNSIFGVGLYEDSEDGEEESLDPVAVSFRSIAITNTPAVDGLQSMVLSSNSTKQTQSYLILTRTKGTSTMTEATKLEADKELNEELKDQIKEEILDELKTDDSALAEDADASTDDAPSEDGEEKEGSESEELSNALREALTQLTGAEEPLTLEEALAIALQMAQDQLAAAGGDDEKEEEDQLMEDALAVTKTTLTKLTKENEELKLQLITHTVESDIKNVGADEAALDGLLVVLQASGQEAYEKLLSTLSKNSSDTKTKDVVNSKLKTNEVIEKSIVASTSADLNAEVDGDEDGEWLTSFRQAFGTSKSNKS